jgi:hypothetical protein
MNLDACLMKVQGEEIVDIIDETAIPVAFNLERNYPNPFNAYTIIKYQLPEESHVIIDIYDILGRKICRLTDEYKQAGYHQIVWHASDIPSGVYFYHIDTDQYAETRQMVLIK